ncbi:hypothetical protein [Compostibacter hankyongensis]|uniref:Secreted protein n=1 Tax=Compostibacter hankyongensis TaxID=1007089 RepID=A0ABP8FBT8_9BACT
MRRNHFWTGALVALVTFLALSVFAGHRPWSRPEGGYRHRHHCYDEVRPDHYHHPDQDGKDIRKSPTSKDTAVLQ